MSKGRESKSNLQIFGFFPIIISTISIGGFVFIKILTNSQEIISLPSILVFLSVIGSCFFIILVMIFFIMKRQDRLVIKIWTLICSIAAILFTLLAIVLFIQSVLLMNHSQFKCSLERVDPTTQFIDSIVIIEQKKEVKNTLDNLNKNAIQNRKFDYESAEAQIDRKENYEDDREICPTNFIDFQVKWLIVIACFVGAHAICCFVLSLRFSLRLIVGIYPSSSLSIDEKN
ncbi:hypothetical protein KM1_007570 [Entamoeba histolytica HM-3:IMSS]|nr:hypothetical protein KM1_007570 [Entamoeba histolytica HM-3:IMSS]GAT93549.1 hypothetical protein CL6EHI_014180 [Entamoeba histolytica]